MDKKETENGNGNKNKLPTLIVALTIIVIVGYALITVYPISNIGASISLSAAVHHAENFLGGSSNNHGGSAGGGGNNHRQSSSASSGSTRNGQGTSASSTSGSTASTTNASSTASATINTTTATTSITNLATTTSTTSAQSTQNYGYGFSVGVTLLGLTTSQLNAEFADMANLGVGWVRMDFDWSLIQPNNATTYDWSSYDNVIAAANAHGIKVLGIVAYTPAWARSLGCNSEDCPPASDSQFATFAAASVTRYAPQGVHDWEVWNEPNNAFFWEPVANAQDYTELLEATYPAIKKADPSAFVISGGLAPEPTDGLNIAPVDFLNQMYVYGAEPYFDAVGFHPYSYPALPSDTDSWNAWFQMFGTSPSIRSIMVANGDSNKQIWMTEYGAPTNGPSSDNPVSEAVQAQMITQAISLKQSYPWAGPLFIYSYKDLGTSAITIENFFGVLRYDGSQKPAYTALKQALNP